MCVCVCYYGGFPTSILHCPVMSSDLSGHGVPIRLIRTSVADVPGLVREFGKEIVLFLGSHGWQLGIVGAYYP